MDNAPPKTAPQKPAHGWIILDKPVGLGSTQAVAAVKRNFRQAGFGKVKVGHGGTLDPLASGVLPIALGEATKLTGRLLDADSRFLFLTVYAVRMSSLAIAGLLAEAFADLPGTIEHGDLAVREDAREGAEGRLLPTAIFARWRAG